METNAILVDFSCLSPIPAPSRDIIFMGDSRGGAALQVPLDAESAHGVHSWAIEIREKRETFYYVPF